MMRLLMAMAGLMAALANPAVAAEPTKSHEGPPLRISVMLPAKLEGETITGRLFLFVARNGDQEPRLQ